MSPAVEREIAVLRKLIGLAGREDVAFYVHFKLEPAEARMLGVLYRAKGRAVSVSRLASGGAHNAVKIHIHRIRRLLEQEAIKHVPERSYALTPTGVALCDEALAEAFQEAA